MLLVVNEINCVIAKKVLVLLFVFLCTALLSLSRERAFTLCHVLYPVVIARP